MKFEQSCNKIMETVKNISMPNETDTIFLFGGGLCGILAAALLKEKLTAICDNNRAKQGSTIEGLPCISPQELFGYQNPFVLVSTVKYYKDIHQQLESMGIRHCSLDAYVVRRHLAEVEEVFSLLDDASNEIFAGVLLGRVTGDLSAVEQYCCDNQYFCLPKFRYLAGETGVFIDCGAFVGDTVERMIENSLGNVSRIYAFEPGGRTYAALQKRVSFLCDTWALDPKQIICEKKGVGEKTEFMIFRDNHSGLLWQSLTHSSTSESIGVPVVVLDEYFAQEQETDVAFIKADIEGSEWDMLHGAKDTIRHCKPKLAICIYHSIFDMFRIPLYLKSLVPEYQFHIRHHSDKDEDTVVYCHL